jgi:hypothetical protein
MISATNCALRGELIAPVRVTRRNTGPVRRSELVALDVEHLTFDAARGLLVMVAPSKADQ